MSTAAGLPGIAADRGTESAKLVKLYRGELDWVLLKALEKDRGRRYQSANAFADDVRNYLADEVVDARPPSRGYRLRKFVRRNRAAVWASAAVFAALLGGVVGTTLGLLEAKRQAGEAEQARKDERQRADGEAEAKQEADKRRIEADEERTKAVAAADGEKAAAAKERAAKETALKRLDQVAKSNRILGSIFDNLDPRVIADSRRPLQTVLVENLDAAVTALDGEAIGDPLVTAQMQFRLGCSLSFSVPPRRQSCCSKTRERPTENRRERKTSRPSFVVTASARLCLAPGDP